MPDWSGGYVTDVEYTSRYFSELSPALIDLALTMRRVRPPQSDGPFSYCELGCGHGLTVNLLAAANPAARFWATDFNPTHIAAARRLAKAAGLDNIVFAESSFSEFVAADLPEFDYVALHGVYSWVSDENRRHIVEFLRRKVRPGGAVYISYNCLPGWSPILPVRELLLGFAALEQQPTLARLDKALDFVDRIAATKRGYLVANPRAASLVGRLRSHPKNYLVHEYLNRDWMPQYFSQVSRELAEAKLVFAASADLIDEIETAAAGKGIVDLLNEIPDPPFREDVRDFLRNQQFRRDIFVKGAQRMSAAEQRKLYMESKFALLTPWEDIPQKIRVSYGELELKRENYEPVARALQRGPMTPAQIESELRAKPLPEAAVAQVLAVLISRGHAAVVQPKSGAASAKDMNAVLLAEARTGERYEALASLVTGGGVPVSWIDQLFLLARADKKEPAGFVAETLERLGKGIGKPGAPPMTPAERQKLIADQADSFVRRRLPILARLGIA